jgi:hypothetical protein
MNNAFDGCDNLAPIAFDGDLIVLGVNIFGYNEKDIDDIFVTEPHEVVYLYDGYVSPEPLW